ncbi:radical SAM protein [Butyrivibrio sp. XPD2002]|uniref:radical SAM protein n=1 Tax=Butyrivibrio sp. XPD2002 TaxID=1280665 RepID=UPI00040508D9|nr:radical SAM protein [Butyrivibrio sp. XPD2002]
MKERLLEAIFFFAEKGKHIGVKREILRARLFPFYRFVCRVLYRGGNYLYLYHVELPVTQRCNLRCKNCVFMMPYFEKPRDFQTEDLLKYEKKLFDTIDAIQIFRILGGEPFLYKNLKPIIIEALNSDKVKTVEIVTNGTILPSEDLLKTLKNPKLKIQISDYGKLSRKRDEIKTLCDDNGINCVIRGSDEKNWFDPGDLHFRGRNKKELKRQFANCGEICRNLHDGRLYFCPRAAFGTKLGIPDLESEYVDFASDKSREQLRKEIYELNQKRYLLACNYCNEGTDDYVPIPVAEQLTDEK